jgi:phosphomevalonate kinase
MSDTTIAERNPTVAVSAPGKVLLAGGYIVLDRRYTGLVFGLSARIHVLAHEIPTSEGVHISEIVVQSPQFLNATWRYGYRLVDNDGGIKVTQLQT